MNYRVTRANGSLCSHHSTRALAEKAVRRLVAMSKGRLTAADFKIEELAS